MSAIVREPVDRSAAAGAVLLSIAPPPSPSAKSDSMGLCEERAKVGAPAACCSGGGYLRSTGGRGLLAEVREEQGLVDAALEDRYAHLHALLDHLTALHTGFASELRGREMDCHRSGTLLWRLLREGKVAANTDALNGSCSICAKRSARVRETGPRSELSD